MSTINKVTGKKYRILKDAVNKIWDEISFINLAQDTIANDGMTVEDKIGDLKGLVTTEQTASGYAMDASVAALAPKVFTGVIRPNGVLTLTFTDSAITSTSKIVIYTDQWGYSPKNDGVVTSGNTLTITFPESKVLTTVKVEVSNFHN